MEKGRISKIRPDLLGLGHVPTPSNRTMSSSEGSVRLGENVSLKEEFPAIEINLDGESALRLKAGESISQKRSGLTLQQPPHFFRYACVEFFVAP